MDSTTATVVTQPGPMVMDVLAPPKVQSVATVAVAVQVAPASADSPESVAKAPTQTASIRSTDTSVGSAPSKTVTHLAKKKTVHQPSTKPILALTCAVVFFVLLSGLTYYAYLKR